MGQRTWHDNFTHGHSQRLPLKVPNRYRHHALIGVAFQQDEEALRRTGSLLGIGVRINVKNGYGNYVVVVFHRYVHTSGGMAAFQ